MPITDPHGADILSRLAADMVGPMAAGARVEALALGQDMTLALTAPLREAALFLALKADLDALPLRVEARLVQPDQGLAPLVFAGWSERGTVLPLHIPVADPATAVVAPFRVKLRLIRGAADLTAAEAADLVEGRLISGRFGRLMAVTEAETVALRRHARAIGAARALATASGEALDRHGSDLGVPRQTARLTLSSNGSVGSVAEVEPDARYRARLNLFHATAFPRPAQYAARLGPDGTLAAMGFAGHFDLVEAANPFALGCTLISVDATAAAAKARRDHFLDFLRDWVLIDPKAAPNPRRRLTQSERAAQAALRQRLSARVDLTAAVPAMAPDLARALDRLASLLRVLGVAQKIDLLRGLDPDAGSRHALGLGIAIAPLKAETIDTVLAATGKPPPAPPAEDRAALASFTALVPPAAAADDPLGAWIFRACGFQTVHLAEPGAVYLSHLTTGALVLAGDTLLAGAAGAPATEDFEASFAPEAGSAASAGIAAATAEAAAVLPGTAPAANPADFLDHPVAPGAARGLRLAAAGLPAITDWDPIRDALAALPSTAQAVLALPAATVAGLNAGVDADWDRLGGLVTALRLSGASTAIPLFTANAAALVISTAPLPVAGSNLTGRASTAFRWFAIPLDQPVNPAAPDAASRGVEVTRRTGPVTTFRALRPGLFALVVLGYQRLGGTDPFEVRVETGPDDQLSFMQYEYLMNLLALRYPAGVEINTWPIRRFHVMADDGTPTPLDPSAARTWRPFRRPRRAGTP